MSDRLSTTRAKLRRLKFEDLDNMVQLESDPEVMRYTPMRTPRTREQSQLRLEKQINNQKSMGEIGVWVAETHKNNEFIGWFMLLPADSARCTQYPELGFMIVKRFWGQGLATEIAREIIRYGTVNLGYSRISAVAQQENKVSIYILKKLGFHLNKTETVVDSIDSREVVLKHFVFIKKHR